MRKHFPLIVCIFLLYSSYVYAYDEKATHRNITLQAAGDPETGKLTNYLKQNLGFEGGLKTRLPSNGGMTVLRWLQEGSFDEDQPICRRSNHFHNPLETWDQSYMNDDTGVVRVLDRNYCYIDGWPYSERKSNVTWATGYLSRNGTTPIPRNKQDMGWDNARQYYYWGLTSISNTGRDLFFTKTFRALGQVLHLLQDVSVPAHVRNDFTSHVVFLGMESLDPILFLSNRYEHYIQNKNTLIFNITPEFPSFTNPRVTDFWDTEQYDGENPSESFSLGLSEFANANYFSDWTIPNNEPTAGHIFPHPMVDKTNARVCEDYAQNSTEIRKYISREVCPPLSQERKAHHFAAISLINEESTITNENIPSLKLALDENVHDTYAKKILPRAVGYSAGLLDYFFRGSIEVSLPSKGVYAQTENRDQGFTRVSLLAKNTSPDEEEMTHGSIELVVRYKKALEDPLQPNPVPTEDNFSYIVAPLLDTNIKSIPRNQPIELLFNLSGNPIPVNITDLSFQVVYKGKLEKDSRVEEGAVAVGFKDINEPTPIDIYNDMDRVCINGRWYVAGSPEAIALGNQFDFDAYPHNLRNIYLRFSATHNPQEASSTEYNLHIPLLVAGDYFIRRAFVLSDYEFSYGFMVGQVVNKDPNDPYVRWCEPEIYTYKGVKNQTEPGTPEQCAASKVDYPCDIRYYPNRFHSFRGQQIWEWVVFQNSSYPPNSSCPLE